MIREEDKERILAILNYAWHGAHRETAEDLDSVECVRNVRSSAGAGDWFYLWKVITKDGCRIGVATDDPGERVILHRNTGFPEVPDSYEDYAVHGLRPPHCDPRVLHAPGECEVCDKHAGNVQRYRTLVNTSFTGKTDNRWPCPADVARPSTNQIWLGNQPWRAE